MEVENLIESYFMVSRFLQKGQGMLRRGAVMEWCGVSVLPFRSS